MTRPIVRVRRVTSARAAGDGLYCSCAMAFCTRARVAGRTLGMVVDHPRDGLVRHPREPRDVEDVGVPVPAARDGGSAGSVIERRRLP